MSSYDISDTESLSFISLLGFLETMVAEDRNSPYFYTNFLYLTSGIYFCDTLDFVKLRLFSSNGAIVTGFI